MYNHLVKKRKDDNITNTSLKELDLKNKKIKKKLINSLVFIKNTWGAGEDDIFYYHIKWVEKNLDNISTLEEFNEFYESLIYKKENTPKDIKKMEKAFKLGIFNNEEAIKSTKVMNYFYRLLLRGI